MPLNNPHAYATRSAADMQQQNPKNSKIKPKSGNQKPQMGGGFGGPSSEGGVGGAVTTKGLDVKAGPKGLGHRFGRLANLRKKSKKGGY